MVIEIAPTLVVTDPAELRGRSISLADRELNIGSAAENDLQLDDPFLSRRHAVVKRAGRELLIEDVGSGSGVVVNDDLAIEPTVLRDGDRVRLGLVELELRSAQASLPSRLSA